MHTSTRFFKPLVLATLLLAGTTQLWSQTVFINEIHYDNAGTDAGEAVEIAGPAGTDLTGWSLVLYNGNGGAAYDTDALSGTIPDGPNGYGLITVNYPANGIQNGAPDGIALVDNNGTVVQFLSYEGAFTAAGGPANGLTSTDIGVSETGSEPLGQSLQLSGNGTTYTNFTWKAASASTFGAVNTGQTFEEGGDNPAPDPVQARIYDIQGDSTASPLINQPVTTGGVVTGDFQSSDQLNGFYIQDIAGDDNEATSDGIFVFAPDGAEVSAGDSVTVTGTVSEQFGVTQISSITKITVTGSGNTVAPVQVALPVADAAFLERYEGMLVQFSQSLTVTENFNVGRFGELVLSTKVYPFGGVEGKPNDGRLLNPTQFIDPTDLNPEETDNDENNVAAVTAQQTRNSLASIVLDDNSNRERGNNSGNIPVNSPVAYADPATNTLRIGSAVTHLTGVLDFGFGRYRIRPAFDPYDPAAYTRYFTYAPRPAVPSVGNANLRAASFNVLNYFNGDGLGGGFPTSRGANTPEEFARQKAKIVNAISELNADVVGLIEIENDGDDARSAIADLVDGLNAKADSTVYAYINDPASGTGTDEIKCAIIYKPAAVSPVGGSLSDTDAVYNRLPIAQTFRLNVNDEVFTFVVNHFKSKGSGSGADADQGDGQGASNFTRTQQAVALADFLQALADSTGDADIISVGDYNAYNQEDPIDVLRRSGYASLSADSAYSYVFQGQSGSLDHALVSGSLAPQITGAADWHINADEPRIADYNTEFNPDYLYNDSPYRSSDHDPVLVGLRLVRPAIAVQFAQASATVTSSSGAYTVKLTLAAPARREETVTIGISNGANTRYGAGPRGGDYVTSPDGRAGSFTLTIPAGSTEAAFTVTPARKAVKKNETKTVTFTLTETSSGLTIAQPAAFTLSIVDDKIKPAYLVFPNPTPGFIRLLVYPREYATQTVTATLRTSNGDVLYTSAGTIRQLESPLSEKLRKGRRGVYLLTITVDGETYQLRILKI